MVGITGLIDDLITQTQHVLGEKGRLSTAIPGFIARSQQIELAVAISEAIQQQSTLVAEAGTGTGKTYAYLIPVLLSGKKTLISTATKTLQDQLFQKDLPELIRALGLGVRIQNLKGRTNYLCRYRLELHATEGRFNSPQSVKDLIYIREKLSQLKQGERQELPEINESSPVWPYVTSTTDNCLGAECAHYQSCFLVKARKRAMEAQIVVINHALFFADSRLKEEGFGELLPGAEVVIFDEAHQIAEIAANFYGDRFSTRQLQEVLEDLQREWSVIELGNPFLTTHGTTLDERIEALLKAYSVKEDRIGWDRMKYQKPFIQAWENLVHFIQEVIQWLNEQALDNQEGLLRCKERLEELYQLTELFNAKKSTQIRWIERFKQTLVFHATPFEIAQAFKTLMEKKPTTFVFTSATLTMASSFACFLKPLGLDHFQSIVQVKTLFLPSPFDFKQQTILYLPRNLPDPKDSTYYEALLKQAIPIIRACGGRCFFLFTSHRALKQVAQTLALEVPYPLLIQGEEAKGILLARFRALGNAVLLGTATFWEGVDVKGQALSCVIIDKLPFASPQDPVVQGRMHYLKSQGLSGFDELTLPNAVLALKQGVGRLIRDAQDRGVLMIADPRLTGRNYGQQIFSSLPPMRKTREEKIVLNFINELVRTHEFISN